MLLSYYYITFIVAFMAWVAFIAYSDKKRNANLAMIFSIVTVANGGYLAMAKAETVEVAILAQKVIYIAVVYAPLFIFFNIASLCKVKLKKIIRVILTVLCSVVYGSVLTVGYLPVYYKSVKMHKDGSISYITKTYGPAHDWYIVVLYGLIIASLVVLICSFKRQKKVSYKNSIMLLTALVVMILSYFVKNIKGTHVQFMPLLYCILLGLFVILHRKEDIYNVSYAIVDSISHGKNGYIILNTKFDFVGCNEMAKVYYPTIADMKIERTIKNDKMLFYQIEKKAERLKEVSFVSWNKKLKDYNVKCELRYMFHNGKVTGYLLELVDDTKQQQYIKKINSYNSELEDAMDKRTQDIVDIQNKIILGMANVVESRDNSTGGHIKRTSEVVRIFIDKLKQLQIEEFSEEFFNDVIKAAPMHDLGKIAIEDNILRKPGKFTTEEYNEMKKHAEEGAVIINSVLEGVEDEKFVQIARNVAHYHHERYDGSGYPENLKGESIPIEARIMAIADVFDALVSERCYKRKFTYEEAFKIIEESIGSHFDPKLGKVFLECRKELEEYYDKEE